MQELLPQLTKYLPYILGTVGVLIAAVAGSLFLLVRNSKKASPGDLFSSAMKQKSVLEGQARKYAASAPVPASAEAAAQALPPLTLTLPPQPVGVWEQLKKLLGLSSGRLGRSFREARKVLRSKIAGGDYRYKVPWFVLMGEAGSGKTTLMNSVGLPNPFGRVGEDPFVLRNPCTWWFFESGLVLDVDGSMILGASRESSDHETWPSFLTQLRRGRPERPLDGLIVTIPVNDLIGPAKLSSEQLRQKADHLYQKIWEAQKMLGMAFPVYVFVTKCDQITGYRSYVSELPAALHDDIFGWSNPYSIQSAFVPDWVDEAFAYLNDTIYKTQIEIFAESEKVEDSDGLFLFPAEFLSMAEPLRAYLNHLFKESAYHESFMFRGVFFSGDAQLDAPIQTEIGGSYAPAASAKRRPAPVFLRHVFEKKIFPEFRLARPVFRSLLARNRWALGGQIACVVMVVVGGLTLWMSQIALRAKVDAFRPVLLEVEKVLSQIQSVEGGSGRPLRSAELLQKLRDVNPLTVLSGMQQINVGTMKSVFLPSSWLSDLDDRADAVLVITFEKIVLGSIYLNLNTIVQQLGDTEPAVPAMPDAVFTPLNVFRSPEFLTLRRFLDSAREVEEYIGLYNFVATPDSGDLEALGKLVKYVYKVELPQTFYENSEFYFRALTGSKQDVIDSEAVKRRFQDKTQVLSQSFFDSLLAQRMPIAQLEELQAELDALLQESLAPGSSPEPYQALIRTIDQLNLALARPELAWMARPNLDSFTEWSQLQELVQASTLLGRDTRTKVDDISLASFDLIRTMLQGYESQLTGPLLSLTESGYKTSDEITSLRKGLEDFLDQKFMANPSGRRIRASMPGGARFRWDATTLQQALQLMEPYNEFAVGGLTSFKPELQRRLRVMALNRLESNMIAIVSSAQRSETSILPAGNLEQEVQNEAKQLKDVSKALSDLLSAFERFAFTTSYNDLSEAVQTSALLQLRLADQLFVQRTPYSFNQAFLGQWDGAEPLASVAFGVKDDKELAPYLDTQRESLKRLKEAVDPALVFLLNLTSSRRTPADAQLLAKWQGIVPEMEKYDNKNSSNSLTALETFVGSTLPTLTLDNYSEKITAQDLAAPSGDFFLERRNTLRREVYERFETNFSTRAVQQYREIETFFNQRLAGKFPFSSGPGGAEADPDSLRAFFKLFDAYHKNVVGYLERSRRTAETARLLQFMDQMTSVRLVFAAFLGDPKSGVPAFDFEVEFRVNRKSESGASNIIEWMLEVGDQRLTARDARRQGRWVMGNPVLLTLRWAKDGDAAPSVSNGPGVSSEDRKVTFEEISRWAVLRLIKGHPAATTDFEQLVDPAPETMKFIIPTVEAGGVEGSARVFVRLTLLTPDKKEPFTLPVFPDRAPAMSRS